MSAIKLGESELLKPVVKVGLSTAYKKKTSVLIRK